MDTLTYIQKRFHIPKLERITHIKGFGRNDLAKVFCELGFTKGIEVGTEKGKYSSVLMASNPALNLVTCDPYGFHDDDEGYRNDADAEMHKNHYKQAQERLSQYPNAQIVTLPSMAVIEPYDDNSLDFVYIDGNHRFDYVAEDVVNWADKVKSGGIVAGHDWIKLQGQHFSHVPYVVQAYQDAYMIPYIFVLDQKTGDKTPEENKYYDRIRSWFFIKP